MAGRGTRRSQLVAVFLAIGGAFAVPRAFAEEAGLYTAAQAERGGQLYQQFCSACHGSQLQGSPSVPLTGESYRARWEDGKHTLDDLYYIIRSLMPNDAPGSLSRAQYADIVAYILQVNRYPAGGSELVPKAADMKAVILQPH